MNPDSDPSWTGVPNSSDSGAGLGLGYKGQGSRGCRPGEVERNGASGQ